MGWLRYVYILLAGVVFVVGMGMIEEKDRSLRLQLLPRMMETTREQMNAFAGHLRDYEKAHGRYPTNDEGLLVVKPLVRSCNPKDFTWDDAVRYCRVAKSGILTRFGDPFVYENRRGIDQRKFADSGATLDRSRSYSVRVDKDVYIWSVGAKQACERLALWRPRLYAAMSLVGLITLVFVVLFIRECVLSARGEPSRLKRWGGGIVSALAGLILWAMPVLFFFPEFFRTCYAQSANWIRKPELTTEYKALLTKYRNRGVINDATYNKITAAMDEHDDY